MISSLLLRHSASGRGNRVTTQAAASRRLTLFHTRVVSPSFFFSALFHSPYYVDLSLLVENKATSMCSTTSLVCLRPFFACCAYFSSTVLFLLSLLPLLLSVGAPPPLAHVPAPSPQTLTPPASPHLPPLRNADACTQIVTAAAPAGWRGSSPTASKIPPPPPAGWDRKPFNTRCSVLQKIACPTLRAAASGPPLRAARQSCACLAGLQSPRGTQRG